MKWSPEVVNLFREAASTGNVEFMAQTYYHSLAWFLNDKREFREQVELQRKLIEEIIGYRPKAAENTEFMYNNDIACTLNSLGFDTIVTEGVDWVLGWRSPNYVYRAYACDAKVLTRHYRLSDDIGFRFSDSKWDQYPLTADKYAAWLAATPGQYILIAIDYESFGEHHWPESGIHEFLRWLPREVIKHGHLQFSTVSEVADRYNPVDVFDVPPWIVISWADERDVDAWLGNDLQRLSFNMWTEMEPYVRAAGEEVIRIWRKLGISDHFYYQATKFGTVGEVHSYFSPYKNALKAFSIYSSALNVLARYIEKWIDENTGKFLKSFKVPPGKEFRFYLREDVATNIFADSIPSLLDILKTIPEESIRYHILRGDFQNWISTVFKLSKMADEINKLAEKIKYGEEIDVRKELVNVIESFLR